MSKTIAEQLSERAGENFELHDKHLNTQMVKVLKTIGYDGCVSVEVFDYTPDAPTIAPPANQTIPLDFPKIGDAMPAKDIAFHQPAREAILRGVKILAEAVKDRAAWSNVCSVSPRDST